MRGPLFVNGHRIAEISVAFGRAAAVEADEPGFGREFFNLSEHSPAREHAEMSLVLPFACSLFHGEH
jgi:hypothetical protein